VTTVNNQKFDLQKSDTLKALVLALPLMLKVGIAPNFSISCIIVFAVVGFWQWIFAHKRQHKIGTDTLFQASLLCLLLPVAVDYWQVALVASFGAVIGEQIYGGRGHSFTSPVLVALALLFYSFQFTGTAESSSTSSVLSYLSLILILLPIPFLLFHRELDWIVFCAIAAGFFMLMLVTDSATELKPVSAVLACVLYCSCDPLLCPKSTIGKALYGLLVGVLLYLLDPAVALIEKAVFACLIGTITAPLLDWLGITVGEFFLQTKAADSHVGN